MVVNSSSSNAAWGSLELWGLNNKNIDRSESETHLGVMRTPDGKTGAAVSHNIKLLARRSLYAILGAGMYGLNGLHPKVSVQLWNLYILPRLVFGLETMSLTEKHLEDLETYQRGIMRRIQHLPPGTANAAVLLLVGVPPVEAVIDQRVLSLYANICRLYGSVERNIVQRQLAMKDAGSNSFVTRVKTILQKYNLTSAYLIFEQPPTKLMWKKQVKTAVSSYWTDCLQRRASQKVSLRSLGYTECGVGELHPVWDCTRCSSVDIQRACVKSKMLTRQYQVGEKMSRYWGKSDVCPLCHQEKETLSHLLLHCPSTATERTRGLALLEKEVGADAWSCIAGDCNKLVQLILDCRHPTLQLSLPKKLLWSIEEITRKMCYSIHCARSVQMDNING